MVRLCHGDLHLRNLFMSPAGPRMFDCIDFNDQIATVDVLYDLAFLLMDLWHRGFADLSPMSSMNRYLDISRDDDGGFVLAALLHGSQGRGARARDRRPRSKSPANLCTGSSWPRGAKGLFRLRRIELLGRGEPTAGGDRRIERIRKIHARGRPRPAISARPPGGKASSKATALRKAMFQVADPGERLPLDAYRPEVSRRVYDEMAERARLGSWSPAEAAAARRCRVRPL